MRRRELAFRTLSVLIGVAIPLAIAEGVAGWLLSRDKREYKPVMPDSVAATVNLGDRHIPTLPDPYLSFRVKPDVARERVQTNDLGLREGPVSPTPAPGTLRVLFLGGSVAWGYTANSNDDTIPSYLEDELTSGLEALRASSPDALRARWPALADVDRVEVLNAGVPAYVAWQEALAYALDRRALRPHWVIALDASNDIEAAIINGEAGVPMRFRVTRSAYLGAEPTPLQALGRWLRAGLRELNVVEAAERLRPRSVEDLGAPPPAAVAERLRAAAAHLADTAARDGARAWTVLQPMVILPGSKPLTDFERRIVREHEHRMPGRNRYYAESYAALRGELEGLARERPEAYAWIDASDAFAATPEPTYTDHCHLTPLGRRLLARRIAAGLLGEGPGAR